MNYHLTTIKIEKQIINLALPKNFNKDLAYSVYLVFDGHQLLAKPESNILSNNNSNKVFIGLNNINDIERFNNFATYQNYDIKPLMSKNFTNLEKITNNYVGGNGQKYLDFIEKKLLPWITKKIKISDWNLLGCSMGAYFSLQMLYLSKITFKKIYLFSASIWFNNKILDDLKTKTLNHQMNLVVNLWIGLKEPNFFEKTITTNYYSDALKIKDILINHQNIKVNFFIDEKGSHGFKWWVDFINNHSDLW